MAFLNRSCADTKARCEALTQTPNDGGDILGQHFLGPKLDFGQKFAGSPSARDVEHGIFLHDLVSVFEHELHAAEVSKGCPTTFEV